MDITEIILAVAIALIHPYFFTKLVDKVLGYDRISGMCDGIKFWDENMVENVAHKECTQHRDQELDKIELSRHITFLVIALLSILVSSMIRQKSTKLGLGLGGIILLITALTLYWRKYNEIAKLFILGIALVIVIYLSIRLYTVQSWADIFSLEFGTKGSA
jgi:hypothetical protein